MRTLVFGCKGQLGRDLLSQFGALGLAKGVDLPECDIAEEHDVSAAFQQFHPELVVNAAAYTDVEAAEDHRDAAFRVNETGASRIAKTAQMAHCPVVYFSTDFVFDGQTHRPYESDDTIRPLSVYGESKAAGEAATRAANDRHFIIRTAWLYGPTGNNFVEKILRAAKQRPELRVVDDEVGSPTHTWDLAEATVALCRTSTYGTYHAVNAGACSRFDLAKEVMVLAGLHTPVVPCKASAFPAKAKRPAYSVLSNARLEAATGYVMRPWLDALKHYVTRRETTS